MNLPMALKFCFTLILKDQLDYFNPKNINRRGRDDHRGENLYVYHQYGL